MPLNSSGWNIILTATIFVSHPTSAAAIGIEMYTHSGLVKVEEGENRHRRRRAASSARSRVGRLIVEVPSGMRRLP